MEFPIIAAPMGPDITGPEFVAAVSNAGALGILQSQLSAPEYLRAEIRHIRELTDRPFGVNFILEFPCADGVRTCIEEGVKVLSFFWGDPAPYVSSAHAAGCLVVQQVGSVETARRAVDSGVDIVIAQGVEAGGHIAGEVSTLALVPAVIDAVYPTPVAAAGGIADGRGLAAVLALGADAAVVGTRFLATPEANAHAEYKARICEAMEVDTVRTVLFGHDWPAAPHRVLRTPFVSKWLKPETRGQGSHTDEPIIGHAHVGGQDFPLRQFMSFPPNRRAEGDIESMCLLAGQSVGLVHAVKPAGEIVREIVDEATRIISDRLKPLARSAHPNP